MSSQQSSQINNQQQQNYLQQRKQQLVQGLIIPKSIQDLNKFDQRKFGVTISSGFIGPIKNNKYLESQHFMFYINLLNHVYKGKRILAFDFYVFCDFMPNLVKETIQYSQKQKEQLQQNQRRLETNRNIQIIQQNIENNLNTVEQLKERIDHLQQELATLMSTNEENHINPSKQEFFSVWGNKDDISTVKSSKSSKSQIIKTSQQEQNQNIIASQVIVSDEQIKKNIITTSIHQSESNLSQEKAVDLLKAGIITNQELNQTQIEQGPSEPVANKQEFQENQKFDTDQQELQQTQISESQAPSEPTSNSELKTTSSLDQQQIQQQNQDESQQNISNIRIQIEKTNEEIKKENERANQQQHQNQLQQQIEELSQQLQKMQDENNQNQNLLPLLQQDLFSITEQLKRIQQEINYLSYDQKKLNEAMRDTIREFRYSNKDQFLINSDKFYFPINLNNNHWISIVVDTVRDKIFYLDSLSRNYRQDIIQGLYQIFYNYLDIDISQYRIESDCPQQQNAYDCGIFALLALLYTYQSSRPRTCEMRDIYQYSQTLVSEYRKRVLIDIAIIASQKNEFSSQDLEFIIENEL